MPKIHWTNLPLALSDHLFERLRGREITSRPLSVETVEETEPEAPEGLVKDFGSFKVWRESTRKHFCCGQPPRAKLKVIVFGGYRQVPGP
jgi:hypothetical protein